MQRNVGQLFLQDAGIGRMVAAVGHADRRSAQPQPADTRKAGIPQARDQDLLAGELQAVVVHLGFNVDKPISTSIMEMIQNRTGGVWSRHNLHAAHAGESRPTPPVMWFSRCPHLSFSVDRPISTSIMEMIQNRTTTCVSFQPLSS